VDEIHLDLHVLDLRNLDLCFRDLCLEELEEELLDEVVDELSLVIVLHLVEQLFELERFIKSCNLPRDISVNEPVVLKSFILRFDIIIIMIYKKIL
jgi:hypothetical protein